MTFINQIKALLWKNWKIFRQKNVIFISMEIFITIMVIGTMTTRKEQQQDFEALDNSPLMNITYFFGKYVQETNSDILGFVLPKDQTALKGEDFINMLMMDPVLDQLTTYKKAHFDEIQTKIFENEEALEKFSLEDKKDHIIACIVFGNDYTDYTIRIKATHILDSKEDPIDNYGKSRKSEYVENLKFLSEYYDSYTYTGITKGDYYNELFVHLQMAVDRTIIRLKTGGAVLGFDAEVGKLTKPYIHYFFSKEENEEKSFNGYAPCIALIFVGQVFHIASDFMKEKESGVRDGLISIGANRILLWLSWEILYLPISLFIALSVLLFDIPDLMVSINRLLFFLMITLYAISIYEITIIICLLIKRAKIVTMILCVIFLSIYKVTEFIYHLRYDGHEKIEKILSLVFSPIGISMSSSLISYKSNCNQHIGISNLTESEYGLYLLFMAIDVLAYFIIAVVIDYGSSLNFRTFGVSRSQKKVLNDESTYYPDIQEDPAGSDVLVQVCGIYKFFRFRRNIATDNDSNDDKLDKVFAANRNISFNVYKDEIFAILGHNGAGKSTLIQNMIGMQKPDKGETYYNGLPLSRNKKTIHKQLGICLQNNVLIKGFTVADHCLLYAGIKGIEVNVEEWAKDVDLLEKKDFEVQKLSGGQKRKVCIGLALIGNPKYVFLDEPTTGLDPLSRRKIWNLLLKKKKDRVIFLTTHYMDEADIIADRKLILNKGCVRCLGSSIFLKNHFNMKYSLEVETNQFELVDHLIRHYVPEAHCFNDKTMVDNDDDTHSLLSYKVSSCYVWKLPTNYSYIFSCLLNSLESQKGRILNDFSLSAPVLEELFVNLEKESEPESLTKMSIELPNSDNIKKPSDVVTGLRLAGYRVKLYFRNWFYWLMAIILPFLILVIIFPNFHKKMKTLNFYGYEKRELSPSLYKNQFWNYDAIDSTMNNTITTDILQQEFPKIDSTHPSIQYYTHADLNNVGKLIYQEPYFVSSFSGDYSDNVYKFKIYYNDSMPHALPSTLNGLSNAILASHHINDTIHVSSYPIPYFRVELLSDMKFYCTIFVALSVTFALSFYGSNVVHEYSANLLKQLQLNGISNKSYWISVFLSDYFWFLITCSVVIITIIICKFDPLYYLNSLIIIGTFFALCSIGCLFFQYCVSFMFNNDSSAFIAFIIINLFPTFFLTYNSAKSGLDTENDEFQVASYYTAIGFDAILPHYCFIRVIKNLVSLGIKHKSVDYSLSIGNLLTMNSQISCHYIGAVCSIVIYSAFLVLLIKKRYTPNRKGVYDIDEEKAKQIEKEMMAGDDDVYHEYQRVKEDMKGNTMPIKIVNLMKEYSQLKFSSTKELSDAMERTTDYKYGEYHLSEFGSRRIVMTAFKNISLGIKKCECFGILGPNGSGKSSLLNTASFTFKQTMGDIYYNGENTLNRKGNEITLGYCPQEDTLWEDMTLYEHIEMFLYIRGYSHKEAKKLAKQFIQYCRLTPHKNKMPSEMSGGTRRKLNILIALCCSSSKVMLDEPSAGMDPYTRRFVWDIVKATLQNSHSSTIMTTHSMEEAELLCNRIGIMVNGKLQCIGSPEHLKMKFGNTYILEVATDNTERFHKEVVVGMNLFGNGQYVKEDKSLQRVKYEVKKSKDIGRIFEIMESCREKGLFYDYSYSQTSLEQIFLNFALLKENSEGN